jgi:uncharacterized protein YbjT (DUF2867 family)
LRALIVGCGCRGQALAAALVERGLAVRGTTRSPRRRADIEAAGAEPVVADPDRLGELLDAFEGVALVYWLMGDVAAPPLHGARLERLLEELVDTPVRGFVYEAAGRAPTELLATGAELVRHAEGTWSIPVHIVEADPADTAAWLGAMAACAPAAPRDKNT